MYAPFLKTFIFIQVVLSIESFFVRFIDWRFPDVEKLPHAKIVLDPMMRKTWIRLNVSGMLMMAGTSRVLNVMSIHV